MSWFGRQLAKHLTGDIAIGGNLTVTGALSTNAMSEAAEGSIQSISSATLAIIGGCSQSITLDGSTSVFLLARGTVSTSDVADLIFLGLYRDSTNLTELTQMSLPAAATAGKTDCFCVATVDKPAAGTYTYSLKWSNDGTNTAYCRAASLHAIAIRT